MPIKPEHLDELLAGYEKPEDLLGEDGLFKQLKKALLERALGAELTHHLGYEKGDPAGRGTGNNRNGTSAKTVLTEDGSVEIDVPRDRNGTFEPQIVPKGESRLDGFDDKIISLYARGMTVREIQGHLRELYAVDVSPDLISRVTDAVLDEVREWQNRPLDTVYPVVFFDALRVKIRDESVVKNKAVYLALALDCEGHKQSWKAFDQFESASKSSSMTASSSVNRNGFVKNLAPFETTSFNSAALAEYPDITITLEVGRSWRIHRARSIPSKRPGIMMSVRTKSYDAPRPTKLIASSAVPTIVRCHPRPSKYSNSDSHRSESSSTRRRLLLVLSMDGTVGCSPICRPYAQPHWRMSPPAP